MKIGNTDDIGSYLNRLTQGTQNQRTQQNRTAGNNSSFMPGMSAMISGDSYEISGQAYDSVSGGGLGNMMPPPDPSRALSGLVEDGTLTSAQAAAVSQAMQSSSADITEGSNPLQSTLDDLVSDGTLTSDQANSIASAMAPLQKQEETETGSQTDSDMGGMTPPPPPPMGMGMSMGGPGGADSSDAALKDSSTDSSTASSVMESSSTSSASTDSDEKTDLIKDIVNNLLSSGRTSKDYLSALLGFLGSLDTDTLSSISSDLSGSTIS